MGISTAFVALLSTIIAAHGYGVAVGAIIVGGIIEGLLGLCAKYWTKFITPVVAGVVVATIGFNLLPVGARSFAGGNGAADFAQWPNILLGTITLVVSLGWQALSPKKWKPLGILAGMVVGYVVAIFIGKVDFSVFQGISIIALPKIFPYKPEFELGAIFSVTLLYIVSATDTIGDTAAIATVAYGREATDEEMRGSIAADGLLSSLAGVFGCLPVDSFGQNIGLVSLTGVLNRRAIATGAALLVLAGFVPAVAAVFTSVPQAVLGGCTITMFGSILVSGLQMIAESGFTQRNLTIAASSLAIGIGFTQVGMFDNAPALIQSLLGGNCVALSFIIALLLNIVLPKDDGDACKAAPAMAEAQGLDSPADASADAENGDGEA
jgi:NCS2 family nucleobase:cation symporter-2